MSRRCRLTLVSMVSRRVGRVDSVSEGGLTVHTRGTCLSVDCVECQSVERVGACRSVSERVERVKCVKCVKCSSRHHDHHCRRTVVGGPVRVGDSLGVRRLSLALPVRAHRERSDGTILEFASFRLGFRLSWRRLKTRCRRPKPATLCPGRGTADPSCTPSRVLRAAQTPAHRISHPPSPGGTSSPP